MSFRDRRRSERFRKQVLWQELDREPRFGSSDKKIPERKLDDDVRGQARNVIFLLLKPQTSTEAVPERVPVRELNLQRGTVIEMPATAERSRATAII